MKPFIVRAAKAAVIVMIIVAIGVVVLDHHPNKAATSNPLRTSSTTSAPSVTKTTAKTKHQTRPAQASAIPLAGELKNRVVGFLRSYYLIKPNDTAASRGLRVARYLAPASLPLLDLSLAGGTQADNNRVQQQLTLHGKPAVAQLRPQNTNATRVLVLAPVAITLSKPDGSLNNSPYKVRTASVWQLKKGQWLMLDFDKGVGDIG